MFNRINSQYVNLINKIIRYGTQRDDRTGVGTQGIFGYSMEFDLRDHFPIVSLKETRWKVAFLEMLFFISGQSNAKWLEERGSKLWTPWADDNGNLGPVYGFNWRRWGAKPDNVPQPKPKLREGLKATYLGVANGYGKERSSLKKRWEGLISRCYDRNSVSYQNYGARGVHVCDEWLEFSVFERDAAMLPGYGCGDLFGKELDKDTLGDGFRYAPETCCWLTHSENSAAKAEYLTTVEKDGIEYSFTNAVEFCRKHGAEAKNFSDLWTGVKNAQVRSGFRLVSRTRLRPEFDQVANLIDGLKNNPHGRRHMVTAWNVSDLPYMALPPCHHSHQCYVDNGYLDLKLFLRSSDVMLGLPFNICGYALLTHLYARAAGLEARRLLVDIGDAHIYANHFDGAMEVIRRVNEPNAFGAPLLNIKTSNIDIDGYKPDDFEVLYYNPKPHIKLEVAV